MRKFLLAFAFIPYLAIANNDLKINTVELMYLESQLLSKALEARPRLTHLSDVDYLYRFADENFRNALQHFKSISQKEEDMGDCSEIIYDLHLIEGNGYGLADNFQPKFDIDKTGRVVAKLYFSDGAFESKARFALSCNNDVCEISDKFDQQGYSVIDRIFSVCK